MIPVNTPLLIGNEKKYLSECIDTGWISSEGPFIQRFEEGIARAVDRKHGIAVSNGSAALDCAVLAVDLPKGSEIIVPTFTIISCVASIVRAGCIPVLVDCDPATWNMNIEQVEEKITANTKAIMVVHIYGLPVDMDPIVELAGKHGLKIIEDAAEQHGQLYKGKPIGSFGDISTFSFYPNKILTTGEGGMVLTNDDALADRCRSLRNLCFVAEKRFIHYELGYNFRMTNMQAALGLAQLEQLDAFVQKKREIGAYYNEGFKDLAGVQLPLPSTDYSENIYWVYPLVLTEDVRMNAEQAMKKLAGSGIGTRPFFYPMHLQPVFLNLGLFDSQVYPVAEHIAERGFYIPSGLGLTQQDQDEVIQAVKNALHS